jgi:hypothetical protein
MRVCHPGPVAFQRANVSGGSRRLIATFESEDFGRPRGLSMAAAVRAPNNLGNTSLAGRASAIIAAVHSGFFRRAFLASDFDGFLISTHLALVGFTQTDHSGLAIAWREYNAMQPIINEAKHAVTPFPVILAPVFPDQGRRPIELFGKVQREAALRKISAVFLWILVHLFIVYTYIQKNKPRETGPFLVPCGPTSELCGAVRRLLPARPLDLRLGAMQRAWRVLLCVSTPSAGRIASSARPTAWSA